MQNIKSYQSLFPIHDIEFEWLEKGIEQGIERGIEQGHPHRMAVQPAFQFRENFSNGRGRAGGSWDQAAATGAGAA